MRHGASISAKAFGAGHRPSLGAPHGRRCCRGGGGPDVERRRWPGQRARGVAAFTDGSAASAASPSAAGPFSSAELAPALLSAAQASALTGARQPMGVQGPVAAFLDTASGLTDAECVSPWGPAEAGSYTDNAYSGIAASALSEASAAPAHTLTQAVIGFSDAGH